MRAIKFKSLRGLYKIEDKQGILVRDARQGSLAQWEKEYFFFFAGFGPNKTRIGWDIRINSGLKGFAALCSIIPPDILKGYILHPMSPTMVVADHMVGKLIGKGGENVKALTSALGLKHITIRKETAKE